MGLVRNKLSSFWGGVRRRLQTPDPGHDRMTKSLSTKNISILSCALFITILAGIIFRNQISTFFSSAGADPVVYLKFNEGVGTTANDSGSARINAPLGHDIVGGMPSYVSKGTFTQGTADISVPVPAGYAAGDLLILFVESANQAIAAPSGWTEVPNSPQGTGTAGNSNAVRIAMFYKVSTASESNVTVTDTGNHTTGMIALFRDVDTANPINDSAGSAPGCCSTSLTFPSVTTTIPNTLIINATGLDNDASLTNVVNSWANGNLSNVTERHDQTGTASFGGGFAFATGEKVTAGSTGSTTASSAYSDERVHLTVALASVNGFGGEPTWKPESECVTGQCLYFDGSEDAVTVGNTDPIDFDSGLSGDMTISAWIRPLSIGVGGTGQVFAKGDNTYLQVVGDSSDGKVDLQASLDLATTDATITISNGIELQKWHHVSFVYSDDSDDEIEIYIDGVLRGTSTNGVGSPASSDTSDILIGGSVGYFHGYIDEFKVYDYAQSKSQVEANVASRGTAKGVSAQFGDDDLSKNLTNGLIGYWKMDEVGVSGANWTAVDSSGNGKNATGEGTSSVGSTVPGKFGNAGYFDGSDSGLIVPDMGSLSTYTIAAWVKPKDVSNSDNLFYWSSTASFIAIDDGICFYVTTWSCTSNTPTIDEWVYIVVNSNGDVYQNGVKDGNIITETVNGSLNIGNRNGGTTNDFNGSIDEVRVYNRVLSQDEVKALYQYAPGPVGWWKMDEGSGSSTLDESGNGSTGILGTGNSAPTWSNGKYGKALRFDGSNDYVSAGTDPTLDIRNAITVETWVKPVVFTNYARFVVKGRTSCSSPYYAVFLGTHSGAYNNVPRFAIATDGAQNNPSNTDVPPFTLGVWQHIAGTYDGTTIKMYMNGVQVYSNTANGTLIDSFPSNPYTLGQEKTGCTTDPYFNGYLDDVRIYNYARTQSQIIEDMNAGHPSIGTPVGSTVLHLKMNEGYGTTVNDSSPQENNGTLGSGDSAPTWTNDGKFGKALDFDGSNDYVTMGDISSSIGSNSEGAVSFWFSRNGTASEVALYYGDSGTISNLLRMQFQSGTTMEILLKSSSDLYRGTVDLGASSSNGSWNHILITAGSFGNKFYYNGVEKSINYSSGSGASNEWFDDISNEDLFLLGAQNISGSLATFFSGSMDDLRIYPFALSADQVKTVYNQGEQIVLGANSTGVGGTSPSYAGSREYCVPGDSATCSAPVGEWKFDEGVGGTANDTSGNGNIGNFGAGNSAPTWSSGRSGKALSFDGNDYVSLTNSSLAVSTNLTVSAWIKRSSTGSFQAIYDSGTATNHWYLSIGSNDRIDFAESGILDNYGNSTITDTGWHHIAVVKSGDGSSNITFYLDGVQDGTASVGSVATPSGNPQIARNSGGSDYFNGRIDSVRIYNYARTPAQIAWEYNRGAPVAHYQLNECTGTTVYNAARTGDNKSVGNNGTLTLGSNGVTSAGTCATSGAWANGSTGKHGASLSFDGSDDYVSLAASNTLFPDEDNWSVGMWFKFANTTITGNGKGLFVAREDATGRAFTFEFLDNNPSEDTLEFYYDDGGGDASTTIATVSELSTNWHYITASYDGSVFRVYLDGRLEQNISSSFAGFGSGVAHIGAYLDDTNTYFNGQIDEVKIFNYALTTDQIKTEMAGGAVRFE